MTDEAVVSILQFGDVRLAISASFRDGVSEALFKTSSALEIRMQAENNKRDSLHACPSSRRDSLLPESILRAYWSVVERKDRTLSEKSL
jgi:hypothetical protein